MNDQVSPELRIVTQPCRKRCAYKGITRYERDRRTGHMKVRASNNFTVYKGSLHESDDIRDAAASAIVWTVKDQAKAVTTYDVFLRRLEATGRVCVEGMTRGIEAEQFDRLWGKLVAAPDDKFLRKLFAFIKQQDQYGWSDAWETRAIEQRSGHMRWLQDLLGAERSHARVTDRQRDEQMRFHKMADVERKSREDAGLPLRRQRRNYIPGCPCQYCTTKEQTTSKT